MSLGKGVRENWTACRRERPRHERPRRERHRRERPRRERPHRERPYAFTSTISLSKVLVRWFPSLLNTVARVTHSLLMCQAVYGYGASARAAYFGHCVTGVYVGTVIAATNEHNSTYPWYIVIIEEKSETHWHIPRTISSDSTRLKLR